MVKGKGNVKVVYSC